jgi:hypothetical protein
MNPNESLTDPESIKAEIRKAIINLKANACPMAVRLAWHASGTYDNTDSTGGSNGATMRFEPETSDGANKGLYIMRYMLEQVKREFPSVSYADIWTYAGVAAIEFSGGPKVPFEFGRDDYSDGTKCPVNGKLPDATQGAQHLRDVFYRMGFDDREIVALSGGHTLGRCHAVRSGFDGPWTSNPLHFDNVYFQFLLEKEWTPRNWNGPLQYEDQSGKYMMLPTDLALKTDPEFRKFVEIYAYDQNQFFNDFALAFGKLISLGTHCMPKIEEKSDKTRTNELFREYAMHGSLEFVQRLSGEADVHEVELPSCRSALHKAAFWGHHETVDFLVNHCKLNMNAVDYNGDTPLHDSSRLGHQLVVEILIRSGADRTIANKEGKTAHELAVIQGHTTIKEMLEYTN